MEWQEQAPSVNTETEVYHHSFGLLTSIDLTEERDGKTEEVYVEYEYD